uniref:Heterokaryon incompatibility domain-containing protein n=1 Tax=Entomoneis paludosa TaxID=265537 RepID=A0A7S2YR52_9STRA|mmetsp:Transcript_6603/g.13807  ORF Transcript_6603/g.13807 Transcript_6603/m.13807 type:complete len:844 (+) Transcript_6603:38-2569(+)
MNQANASKAIAVEAKEKKEQDAHEVVKNAIQKYGTGHINTFQAWFGYANILLSHEKYRQAELVLRESLDLQWQYIVKITKTELTTFMEVHVGTMFMLGNSLWRQRHSSVDNSMELVEEAIFLVEQARNKANTSLGQQHSLSKTVQNVWNNAFGPQSNIQLPTRQCYQMARVTGGYPSFGAWQTRVHPGKSTTLMQQIDLAMRLANCALGPTVSMVEKAATKNDEKKTSLWNDTDLEPTDYIEALQTPKPGLSEQELEMKSLVTWKGIQVGWFLNVFCKSPLIQLHCQYGCQLWFFRKVCVIEMIRRAWLVTTAGAVTNGEESKQQLETLTGPFVDHMDKVIQAWELDSRGTDNAEIVADATTFLSYTGAYTLEHVIQVLEQLNPKEYLWMDVFCVNQFAWTGMGRTHSMKSFRNTFLEDLQGQIKTIGKTVLVLERWDNLMVTIEQIWVLWEVFNSAQAKAKFNVLLPPDQLSDFVERCLENDMDFEKIDAVLASIDAKQAKAGDDADRSAIYERMENTGFARVHSVVASAIRSWWVEQGESFLVKQRENNKNGPSCNVLVNLARLLVKESRYLIAEDLCKEAWNLTEERQEYSRSESLALKKKIAGNLVLVLNEQGRQIEAQKWLDKSASLRTSDNCQPRNSRISRIAQAALLDYNRGNLEKAAASYKVVLQSYETQQRRNGYEDPETFNAMCNYAHVLRNQQKLDEAQDWALRAVEGHKKLHGEKHVDTLGSYNSLGMTLLAKNELPEAEKIFRLVQTESEHRLGSEHIGTMYARFHLSEVLYKQYGDASDEAKHQLRFAIASARSKLTPNHPFSKQLEDAWKRRYPDDVEWLRSRKGLFD